jgi:putative tricarboxylic transport membrane protein
VNSAALAIQWHLLAMFAPSFFTGRLMARFGKERVAAVGMVLIAVAAVVALSGVAVENFWLSLMIMGLVFAVVLARGSILKAICMILLGLLLATVGTDLETGQERMTLGIQDLSDGVDFAVLAMGIFGFAEIVRNLENPETRDVVRTTIGRLLPSRQDVKDSTMPVIRGTLIGSILGILPGNGAVLGPFASYTVEKKLAKDPKRFGRGAIEGVAGPESEVAA